MSADWGAVLEQHPHGKDSDDETWWGHYLAEHPDVLHRLLADLYQATYGSERPPALEDLWDLVAVKRFSVEPFGEAAMELLSQRDHSIRWLAQQTGFSHTHLRHLLDGRAPIVNARDFGASMRQLELIARALRVHPSFFVEWRRLWIMHLLDAAFTVQPNLSVGVFRRFSGFERDHRNVRSRQGARR